MIVRNTVSLLKETAFQAFFRLKLVPPDMKLQLMKSQQFQRLFRSLIMMMILIQAGSAQNLIAQTTKPAFQYKSGEIQIPSASADEPTVGEFNAKSFQTALKYLDDGALAWTRERK